MIIKMFPPDQICRVCLKNKLELFLIFDENYAEDGVTISQILTECTRYSVKRYDDLPHQICSDCMDAARSAIRFKRQTEKSYRTLIGLLGVDEEHIAEIKNLNNLCDTSTQTDKFSIHPCESCGEKFFDIFDLRAHRLKTHRDTIKRCKVCGKMFLRLRQLRGHLSQEHPNEGFSSDVQCPICLRRFSRKDHMKRHLKNIHKEGHEIIKLSLDEPEIDILTDYCNEILGDEDRNNDSDIMDITTIKLNHDSFAETRCRIKVEPTEIFKQSSGILDMEVKPNIHNFVKTEISTFLDNCDSDLTLEVSQNSISNNDDEIPCNVNPIHKYLQKNNNKQQQTTEVYTAESKSIENRCNECQRTFSRSCHLRRHMLTHQDEKPHACEKCPKRFVRSDHLKMHIINVHSVKEYKCEHCDIAFARSDALARHKECRHGSIEDLNIYKVHHCEYCDKKFTSSTYLRKHKLIHTDRVFACKQCDKKFMERKTFREHEKTHSVERNYLCSVCGDSFVRNDYLIVHMRRHNGEKPYKCQYCGKGFPRATDVKVHERYHTGTKPNLCTLCGKGFHRAYNLTIHMRTHTGERPFKCDQCPKSFTQSNDLKAHKRRHTGERFKCSKCDAAFLQLYGLRQHALSIHGIHIKSTTGRLQKFIPTVAAIPTDTDVHTIANESFKQNVVLPAVELAPL